MALRYKLQWQHSDEYDSSLNVLRPHQSLQHPFHYWKQYRHVINSKWVEHWVGLFGWHVPGWCKEVEHEPLYFHSKCLLKGGSKHKQGSPVSHCWDECGTVSKVISVSCNACTMIEPQITYLFPCIHVPKSLDSFEIRHTERG